jgi:hypothetical protein
MLGFQINKFGGLVFFLYFYLLKFVKINHVKFKTMSEKQVNFMKSRKIGRCWNGAKLSPKISISGYDLRYVDFQIDDEIVIQYSPKKIVILNLSDRP